MTNTADDFNVSASYVQFQMSHQITLTQDTNAKGFSACCENSYGKKSFKYSFENLPRIKISYISIIKFNIDTDLVLVIFRNVQ